ncbi:MAG: GNAT family N-acetyltransferase [Clostridia bacterium]|nr:GNAT family N-acetyltransferase [Clostridia bacterium]
MTLTGTQRLETKRLILRLFQREDAEDMFRNWACDSEVTRYLTWPAHESVDVTRHLLEDWIARYGGMDYFNWAIEHRETGHVIGNISVVRLDTVREAAEIGYCLSRAFWGQSIMPEALRAVMDYLFDTVGLWRVAACHDARNAKSGRVMEKAGMLREGVWRGAGRNNQGICDEVWYAALRTDRAQASDVNRSL